MPVVSVYCHAQCQCDPCLSTGVLGCLWFVLWMLTVHDSPAQHPRISQAERHYIESSVGQRKVGMTQTGAGAHRVKHPGGHDWGRGP